MTFLALLGYEVGANYTKVSGPIGTVAIVIAVLVVIAVIAWYLRGTAQGRREIRSRALSAGSGHVRPGARGVCFSVVTLGPLAVPVGHHLVRDGLGETELDEALDLVGHHLVAGGLDRGDEILDGNGGSAFGHHLQSTNGSAEQTFGADRPTEPAPGRLPPPGIL